MKRKRTQSTSSLHHIPEVNNQPIIAPKHRKDRKHTTIPDTVKSAPDTSTSPWIGDQSDTDSQHDDHDFDISDDTSISSQSSQSTVKDREGIFISPHAFKLIQLMKSDERYDDPSRAREEQDMLFRRAISISASPTQKKEERLDYGNAGNMRSVHLDEPITPKRNCSTAHQSHTNISNMAREAKTHAHGNNLDEIIAAAPLDPQHGVYGLLPPCDLGLDPPPYRSPSRKSSLSHSPYVRDRSISTPWRGVMNTAPWTPTKRVIQTQSPQRFYGRVEESQVDAVSPSKRRYSVVKSGSAAVETIVRRLSTGSPTRSLRQITGQLETHLTPVKQSEAFQGTCATPQSTLKAKSEISSLAYRPPSIDIRPENHLLPFHTEPLPPSPLRRKRKRPIPAIGLPISSSGGLIACMNAIELAFSQCRYMRSVSLMLQSPKRRVITQTKKRRSKVSTSESVFRRRLRMLGPDFTVVAHASFTSSLGSSQQAVRLASLRNLERELSQARRLGISTLIFHLGCCDVTNPKVGQRLVARQLRRALSKVPDITLAIETMTNRCKGEMAASIDDLAELIRMVDMPGRLKICLDLCHVLQEYDITHPQGRSQLFAALDRLGYENVAVVQLSDSFYPHGSEMDSHANGVIPIEAFRDILRIPQFVNLPVILETPGFYPHLDERGSTYAIRIGELERQRRGYELEFLVRAVRYDNLQWEKYGQGLEKEWKERRRGVEREIGKLGRKMIDRAGGSEGKVGGVGGKVRKYRERIKSDSRKAIAWRQKMKLESSNTDSLADTPIKTIIQQKQKEEMKASQGEADEEVSFWQESRETTFGASIPYECHHR